MASSSVTADITVQLNDKFTKSADQAFKQYIKSWKEVEKTQKEAASEIDGFFKDIEDEVSDMGTITQLATLTALAASIKNFPTVMGPAIGALAGFYVVWKEHQKLEEWTVGDKPIDKYLKVVGDSFENLASAKPLELQIVSQDISEQLSQVELLKRNFEAQQGLFLHLDLLDNASGDAQNVRDKLENTFKKPITQIIKIEQVQGSITLRKSPGRSNSGDSGGDSSDSSSGSGDSGGGFDGSSVNPGGFDTFGSFSTGIDRVPRDMLAMIHKDETVLTKTEAEERRSGNSGGMAIQRVSINMNMPDSFNPSNMKRQDFRQFAMKMQDELRRLDRRMSR
jgi:hypothetical protein